MEDQEKFDFTDIFGKKEDTPSKDLSLEDMMLGARKPKRKPEEELPPSEDTKDETPTEEAKDDDQKRYDEAMSRFNALILDDEEERMVTEAQTEESAEKETSEAEKKPSRIQQFLEKRRERKKKDEAIEEAVDEAILKEKEAQSKKRKELMFSITLGFIFFFIAIIFFMMIARPIQQHAPAHQTSTATQQDLQAVQDAKRILGGEVLSDEGQNELKGYNLMGDVESTLNPAKKKAPSYASESFKSGDRPVAFNTPKGWQEDTSFVMKKQPDGVQNIALFTTSDLGVLENVRVTRETLPKDMTSTEYLKRTDALMKEIFPKYQKVREDNLTVAGRQAMSRTYTWYADELAKGKNPNEWTKIKQQQLYISDKQGMYIFTITADATIFDKNYSDYQEIIKTFEIK